MKRWLIDLAKSFGRRILALGFDPRALLAFRYYPLYRKQRKQWLQQGGKITKHYMVLSDYSGSAGTAKGHYFHQDLLVAQFIAERNPKRHVDVGSRIDGFVAHVASFREVEVVDIRPLSSDEHPNIKYVHGDLTRPKDLGVTDSLSCLHAIEHFGLGRYTDAVDVSGHIKGIENLVSLLETGGHFYISFPIGQEDEVHFNAHRVFHPRTIFTVPCVENQLSLRRFDYVNDKGELRCDVGVEEAVGSTVFGCGIYTFEKVDHPSQRRVTE